ncbi:hypothetical protein QBC40DRAFT_60753 [Triangularia verruculosa]|uniref:Uncharacterized protein n=1 Tax=Triangularia verruculosa TaxID=2587418 RepID=A0AAN7AVZ7_9PEZI|nr:hypothetical protein QBC40DRAFT_60753 [Triangularia verruculosa]
MAFHQPTRQVQQQRITRAESEDGGSAILSPQARLDKNESHTWVLFTPATDAGTTTSYLSSVQDDQITPGRSRISDLGSLGTAARSDFNSQPSNSVVPSVALVDSIAEDDAELDSLDSHLPDFRTTHSPYHQPDITHSTHIFPSHDGLGSFRFEAPGNSAQAQERLYAFEQFNPNRVTHRKESFDLARLQLETEEPRESDRNHRIEAWRLEQSQLLLEDIRKETKRRRRQSELSAQRARMGRGMPEDVVAKSVADEEAEDINLAGTEWHDQDGSPSGASKGGLLSRITRKVICDLMGIDDKLLAILFGEVLPDDDDMATTPRGSPKDSAHPAFAHMEAQSHNDSTWQLHMLERIAKELGGLVHQMSAHPGAFSSHTRVQQAPLPYAGLPMIPEAPGTLQGLDSSAASMPQFKPTIGYSADAGVAKSPNAFASTPSDVTADLTPNSGQTFTQQEWEQDLDIRLVFRYLRSRFTSSRPSSPPFTSGTSHLATSSTQELAAKAARVRQHHPLVSHAHASAHGHHRPRPAERRTFRATTPSNAVAMRHGPGSCASQSTRRSARRSSMSSRQSSRHFWDIGGSIGTGSIIASAGPIMGSWGEV